MASSGVRVDEPEEITAGRALADLPEIGLDHLEGVDVAAQGGTVGDEQDRRVAAHVHRAADGVGVVEDVGRVAPTDAAVRAREELLRVDLAHAVRGAVRGQGHLEGLGEELLHALLGHVVWRGLGAGDRAQLPLAFHLRPLVLFDLAADEGVEVRGRRADLDLVARLQLATLEPAVAAEDARRLAAQIDGHVDAAGHGEVGAEADVAEVRELDRVALVDLHGLVHRDRLVVDGRLHVGAGEGDHGVVGELALEVAAGDLDAGLARGVADAHVAEPERDRVERT